MPRGEGMATRIHLSGGNRDGYAPGIDSNSLFVVVGTSVMPPATIRIAPVESRHRRYRGAEVGEYYVDVDLSSASVSPMPEVLLFHSDRAGNRGVLRLRRTRQGRVGWVEVAQEEKADVLWQTFAWLSTYKSADEMPEHTRKFVKYYGSMDPMPLKAGGRAAAPPRMLELPRPEEKPADPTKDLNFLLLEPNRIEGGDRGSK